MHGDVEKSKAPKSNNNIIQRGNFYSSMTNGGQGIVSPVLSSLDPVDANYKGCILFVSIDRDDFKSELLSKENFHSTPSPLMNFPFRPMTTVLFLRRCALSPGAHCQKSDTTWPVSKCYHQNWDCC